MESSLCYSCDHAVIIKYKNEKDMQFKRIKCIPLMEYVEKYPIKQCSHHYKTPSVEEIRDAAIDKWGAKK